MHEDEERTLATWTAHRRIIDDLIAADGGDLGVRGRQRSRRIRERRRRGSLSAVGIQQALTQANRALDVSAWAADGLNLNCFDDAPQPV